VALSVRQLGEGWVSATHHRHRHDRQAHLAQVPGCDTFMAAFTRYNFQWEPQLRAALRLSLETSADQPVLRRGRAIGWVNIRSATGIESLVWLLDVAGLPHDQAAETVRRTAQALLDAALAGRQGALSTPT
jgi:hypothetical protein